MQLFLSSLQVHLLIFSKLRMVGFSLMPFCFRIDKVVNGR